MIRHIVLWTIQDGVNGRTKQQAGEEIKATAYAMAPKIPGLLHLEIGFNYKEGEYDLALYSEFESKEAEAAYQTHPEHLKLKAVVHTYAIGRTSMDMEVE
ncbi:Dabb family protein [Oscillospiraceae bacterium MB08-C2-2]|nr:Dabb family protein [Oscillospiraceae bacterium MB08-C2-2]